VVKAFAAHLQLLHSESIVKTSRAAEAGFVPLPEQASRLALEYVQTGRLGSVFGGTPEVGVTIDELLKREAKP
jgi:hypothetical protein